MWMCYLFVNTCMSGLCGVPPANYVSRQSCALHPLLLLLNTKTLLILCSCALYVLSTKNIQDTCDFTCCLGRSAQLTWVKHRIDDGLELRKAALKCLNLEPNVTQVFTPLLLHSFAACRSALLTWAPSSTALMMAWSCARLRLSAWTSC
jgi:hypothetical protein